jgi:hypothetical protein
MKVKSYQPVMAGLVPAIHVFVLQRKTWIPGTRAFGAARG